MKIPNHNSIELVNLVNEGCAAMDHDYVGERINKPNPDLNMDTPMDIFNSEGAERVYRLLYFIDIGEADL